MRAFVAVLLSFLFVSSTFAFPISLRSIQHVARKIRYPACGPSGGSFCSIMHPRFQSLCPRRSSDTNQVDTPLGTAQGAADGSGATRFAVKYASASRWEASKVATSWTLPCVCFSVSSVVVPWYSFRMYNLVTMQLILRRCRCLVHKMILMTMT